MSASVSSYIGADIVAGAYVCELHKADENVLFIDIGTNGEIVFSDMEDYFPVPVPQVRHWKV